MALLLLVHQGQHADRDDKYNYGYFHHQSYISADFLKVVSQISVLPEPMKIEVSLKKNTVVM